jgi:hypothetical protein
MTDMTDVTPAADAAVTFDPADPLNQPLTGLEQVIEAALADPVHWRAFEALLPAGDLFVVPEGAAVAGTGMRTLRPDETLDLRGVVLADGVIAGAVFTDPRRIAAIWGQEVSCIAMNGIRVLKLFRDRPVLLNHGSARPLLFQIEDVDALIAAADALPADPVRPTGTVQLGHPEKSPVVLLERLRTAFGPADGDTGISAAWVARAHWAETNHWGWMVDVRTARPADEIRAMVGRAVAGVSFGDETLDVSVAPAGGKAGAGIKVV